MTPVYSPCTRIAWSCFARRGLHLATSREGISGHGTCSRTRSHDLHRWRSFPTRCTLMDRASSSAQRVSTAAPWGAHSPSTPTSQCGQSAASGCCLSQAGHTSMAIWESSLVSPKTQRLSATSAPVTRPAWTPATATLMNGPPLLGSSAPKKLFSGNPGERHVSATLVYLGSKSKFCLVECIYFEDVRDDQVLKEGGKHGCRHSCYMYRLTKFTLSYDSKGDLKTKSRRVGYYKVPKKASAESIRDLPVAFWL